MVFVAAMEALEWATTTGRQLRMMIIIMINEIDLNVVDSTLWGQNSDFNQRSPVAK